MDCPKCGKKAPRYSAFCGSCGASLGRSGASWRTGEEGGGLGVEREARSFRPFLILLGVVGLVLGLGVLFGDRIGALFGPSAPSAFEAPVSVKPEAQQARAGGDPGGDFQADLQGELPGESWDSAAALPATLATAEGEFEELVLAYLDRVYELNLQEFGFQPAFQSHLGFLAASARETLTIALPPYADIAIVGVCDNECSEFDLVLLSESGEVRERNATGDDIPLIRVKTGPEERFSLDVRMVTCTVEPCYYAVGMFRRGR